MAHVFERQGTAWNEGQTIRSDDPNLVNIYGTQISLEQYMPLAGVTLATQGLALGGSNRAALRTAYDLFVGESARQRRRARHASASAGRALSS